MLEFEDVPYIVYLHISVGNYFLKAVVSALKSILMQSTLTRRSWDGGNTCHDHYDFNLLIFVDTDFYKSLVTKGPTWSPLVTLFLVL